MSNQITEHTINSHYVIEVQNGRLDFYLKFANFVRRRENSVDQCVLHNKSATNLLNKLGGLRVSMREGCCWLLKLNFDK